MKSEIQGSRDRRSAVMPPSRERVDVAQAGEALEVRVRRMQLRLVLDGQRGQVGIRHEIAGSSQSLEQAEEDLAVAISGMEEVDVRLSEPGADVRASLRSGERPGEDLGMGRDSDEPEGGSPGQTHGTAAAQEAFPPAGRGRVARRILVVRVDEQVDV